MKQHIRPDIDYKNCKTYSSIAHMYAAISVEDSPVYSTRIESANNQEVLEHKKGGIIVFPQGTDSLNPAFRISRPDLIGVHP